MPRQFKAGDTPRLVATLQKNRGDEAFDAEDLDLEGAAVRTYIYHEGDEVLVANDDAEIVNAAEGQVSYRMSEGQTARVGEYAVEFVAEWPPDHETHPGRRKTWPVEGFEAVESTATLEREQDLEPVEAGQDLVLGTLEADRVGTPDNPVNEGHFTQLNVGHLESTSHSTEEAGIGESWEITENEQESSLQINFVGGEE